MDITIKNLSKAFDEQLVLNDFTHTFKEGTTTCIMGKSGVGKTTLLSILMGLENADSGQINGLSDKKISAVFQEDRLCMNLTALLNIKMVLPKNSHISDERIISLLSKIGIDASDKKTVSEYSGGMCRRVAILRALLADFDLLIMDEPLKGLDTETKEKVISLIKELTTNKTVILTTHDPTDVDALSGEALLIQ
ncbi:NitT/TauT family transport system ATP-binding protein [Pseudobutyrivibrio sp. ACV-2]|uniref:ATP-binding cassette domain-containing protein n=1 Tax=Pseudobutyrivibrio sp. ACV-2 TaxID=1520801 RepID=UPI0008998260|nr:ATP-binding cassette domain-containing protein [Pseudobutyrivibrio sp. ACV-2]SEA22135.1 NitT/TauT family transport system ATP-binding protein [Pseudobutyrivibrio sp. ACV-2]